VIAKLTGVVDSSGADWAIIDVGGIGYLTYCSGRTLAQLPGAGGRVSLVIETHVREDHIHLYGFADAPERDWFRMLTVVQGVGARVALALLSALSPARLAEAVLAGDRAVLTGAQGVGPKLAQRILTELRDKVDGLPVGLPGALPGSGAAAPGAAAGPLEDAVSALVNLGYRRGEAFGAVSQAARRLGEDAAIEALITQGLKELAA
jgi:holliday junction DNA helicase RuvA